MLWADKENHAELSEREKTVKIVIREIKIKITTRYHYPTTRMAKIIIYLIFKKLLPSIVGRSVKWHNHFRKMCYSSLKTKHIPVLWPRNSTPMYVPKETKSICPHNNLYKYAPNSFIHNNLQTAQVTINKRIQKQNCGMCIQ